MRARILRLVLAAIGVALLVLGLLRSAVAILSSFHSSGSSTSAQAFSLMIPLQWPAVALAGALLCVLAFFVGRRKV